MNKASKSTIQVKGETITVLSTSEGDYISLTDMLRAKDGIFFHLGLAPQSQFRGVSRHLGMPCSTRLLIMANSPQLKAKLA